MQILVFLALVTLSHTACCYGYTGENTATSPDFDLYGELLTRIQRLEQRDQQQAEKITALESKMAAMADVIEEQEREIETLKKRTEDKEAVMDSPTAAPKGDQESSEPKPDTEHDASRFGVQESAIRNQPGPEGARKISKRAAEEGKIAFFARSDLGPISHLGVNQNIIFEKVVVNIGNAYNPHHGVFIAPVAGTYLISSSILSSSLNKEVQAHIAVNGNTVVRIWARGTDDRHDQGSQTIVLTLQQGDDVSVQNQLADDAIWGSEYCSFSGVLLWPTLSESVILG